VHGADFDLAHKIVGKVERRFHGARFPESWFSVNCYRWGDGAALQAAKQTRTNLAPEIFDNVLNSGTMKTSLTFAIFCAILAQDSARGEGAGEIQERNVDLKDGTRIHLLESGRPSAAPVLVFIPG